MAPESGSDRGFDGTSHYFDDNPATPSRPGIVRLQLPDGEFRLHTDRGVFSADRVDTGTKSLLVETSPVLRGPTPLPDGDLVDLGAGYGPITVALAHRPPSRRIWAVEPNERARELCRANVDANCPDARVSIVAPEEVPPDLIAAAMFSNPPIRIGKPALHSMLLQWLGMLAPEGTAWLVVQRHLGSDSLARWIASNGYVVERVASRKGYRILSVRSPH